MKADLQLFRLALTKFLNPVLADPRYTDSTVEQVMRLLAREFGGQTIPRIQALDLLKAEAQAANLLPAGAREAAARQMVSRSTIYRRAQRHRDRKAA